MSDSDNDLLDWEESLKRQIDSFQDSGRGATPSRPRRSSRQTHSAPPPVSRKHVPSDHKSGLIVRLAVRKKTIDIDEVFEHHSTSISELEARLEAEKAATKAGWPIIGYVIDVKPR